MITRQHIHKSWQERERESYIKYSSLMLVQGNVRRAMKLGVIIGESGRCLGVVWTQLSKKNLRLITLPLVTPSVEGQMSSVTYSG